MALSLAVTVTKIEFFPAGSVSLVIEHTTSILQNGNPLASRVDRAGYDITTADGKAALTQAFSDAGLTNITVS